MFLLPYTLSVEDISRSTKLLEHMPQVFREMQSEVPLVIDLQKLHYRCYLESARSASGLETKGLHVKYLSRHAKTLNAHEIRTSHQTRNND